MKVETKFFSFDGKEFASEEACKNYETLASVTIPVPLSVLQVAHQQASPYGVAARQRWGLRSDIRAVVEVQAPEYLEMFPAEKEKPPKKEVKTEESN